jgi:hypothetical protein
MIRRNFEPWGVQLLRQNITRRSPRPYFALLFRQLDNMNGGDHAAQLGQRTRREAVE